MSEISHAYYFCLGGAVGKFAGVSRPVGYRCAAPLVPDAIERLLRGYLGGGAIPMRGCARGLRATRTTSCARNWQVRFWSQSSAT